jgi:hypothetical protein
MICDPVRVSCRAALEGCGRGGLLAISLGVSQIYYRLTETDSSFFSIIIYEYAIAKLIGWDLEAIPISI